MKRKLSIVMMIVGSVLIAAALGLLFYNEQEQMEAGEASRAVVVQLVDVIQEQQVQAQEQIQETTISMEELSLPEAVTEPVVRQMPEKEIDGNRYIGILWIEELNRELPVMSDWSYPQLEIAPCRYAGSTYEDNLVILGHNYYSHFSGLQELRSGDLITFTDVDGVTTRYEVVALDVLQPSAVEEMLSGDYDLTLFTCTYGGKNRVTVRCDAIE